MENRYDIYALFIDKIFGKNMTIQTKMVLKNVALFIAYNFILSSITLFKTAKKVELWKIEFNHII